jgi:hypothetical protein
LVVAVRPDVQAGPDPVAVGAHKPGRDRLGPWEGGSDFPLGQFVSSEEKADQCAQRPAVPARAAGWFRLAAAKCRVR